MVCLIPAGNVAVTEFLTKLFQLLKTFRPNGFVGIPNEPSLVQRTDPLICYGRSFAFHFQLVLVALSLRPLRQRRIIRMTVRDQAMTVHVSELQQLFEFFGPIFSLVRTELHLL